MGETWPGEGIPQKAPVRREKTVPVGPEPSEAPNAPERETEPTKKPVPAGSFDGPVL